MLGLQVLLPIPPATDEFLVVLVRLDQMVGDCQEDSRFRTGLGGQPEVGMGGGVGQARIEDDELGAVLLPLHDALRMGVEVVAGLQMGADQKDHLGPSMIGTGAVDTGPKLIAGPGSRRADVGMRVVGIAAPGGHHALGEAILAGTPDVVHDLFVALLLHGLADPRRHIIHGLIPADALPFPLAAGAGTLERVEDAIGIGDLIQRGGALGTVAASRARMFRVALELANLEGIFVDVGQQPTGRFAVEARRRYQHVAFLDALGPGLGVELDPIIPAFLGRERCEVDSARPGVESLAAGLGLGASGADTLVQILDRHDLLPQASGTA